MKKNCGSFFLNTFFILLLLLTGFAFVLVLAWQRSIIEINLLPNKANGTLVINITPVGSQVYVDNQLKGQTPFQTELKVGNHTVRVEKENAEPFETTVQIKAGETVTLYQNLLVKPITTSVSENGAFPTWSPTGELMYFQIDTGEIQTYPSGKIVAGPFNGSLLSLSYSVDRKYVVVNLLQELIPDLMLVNLDSGQVNEIGSGDCPATWTASEIFTLCWDAADRSETSADLRLWKGTPGATLQAQGQTDFSQVRPARKIGVSGNGKWLSILTDQQLTLWRLGANGAIYANIIQPVETMAWSPGDLPQLAYLDGSGNILTVSPENISSPTLLATVGGAPLFWSSDGSRMYFLVYNPSEGGSSLWSVDINNGARVLVADASMIRGHVEEISISPDQRMIAYSTDNHILYAITLKP